MRRYFRRLSHRDAVLSNLNALLLLYPPKRQFSDDFPQLKSVIRAHFDDGMSAPRSALQIAETIIGNFVLQLDDGAKAAVLDALLTAGPHGFAEMAESVVKGKRAPPPGDGAAFVTRLAGVAIFMADRMAKEGALGRHDLQSFVARLAAALGADAAKARAFKDSFVSG